MKRSFILLSALFAINCFSQNCFSQALPDENRFYVLVNKGTQSVLGLGGREDFPTGFGPFLSGDPNTISKRQPFKFIKLNSHDLIYFIQKQNSDSTIDIPSRSYLAHRIIIHKLNNQENQQFILVPTGDGISFYIASVASGFLIDETTEQQKVGTHFLNIVKDKGFTGKNEQKWILQAAPFNDSKAPPKTQH